jgi:hypothetical protein
MSTQPVVKPKRVTKISDLPGYVKKQPEPPRTYKKPVKRTPPYQPNDREVEIAIDKLRQSVLPLEPPQPSKGHACMKKRFDNIINYYLLRAVDSDVQLDRGLEEEQVVYRPVYRPIQPRPVAIQPVIPKVIQTPIVSRQVGGIANKPAVSSTESTPVKKEPKRTKDKTPKDSVEEDAEPKKKVIRRTKVSTKVATKKDNPPNEVVVVEEE